MVWPRPGCRDILRDICLKKTNSNVVSCRDICQNKKPSWRHVETCRILYEQIHIISPSDVPRIPSKSLTASDLTILARGFQGTPHIEPLSTQMPEQFASLSLRIRYL